MHMFWVVLGLDAYQGGEDAHENQDLPGDAGDEVSCAHVCDEALR